ncbi:hypothetical protein [Roseicella frigidaeris]|uniref:Type II toxin-antitoxin system PemK/MazF family toxin n=1 Tax=Roseicella frigidaeris TaxID=2230885 RepID=A0A327M6C8_9PROT|nr:hypothetical protein [Roseicella frigidaeris]RAI58289.1 hypothetical protein DOO78_14850 [Roseicella frigidaeris]
MPLPEPVLGLVVHYGFVWAGAGRRAPPDAGKSRPCLVVDLEAVREPAAGGRLVTRVTYLPISHVAPRAGEQAIPIPPRVARHLGLTHQASYLYTSYAVEDDWPFDLEPVPGSDGSFEYGLIPPRLFAAVAADFASYLAANPRSVHRRPG